MSYSYLHDMFYTFELMPPMEHVAKFEPSLGNFSMGSKQRTWARPSGLPCTPANPTSF